MKFNTLILICLTFSQAPFARADFNVRCKVEYGAERTLAKAPDSLEVEGSEFIKLTTKNRNKKNTYSDENKTLVDLSANSYDLKVKINVGSGALAEDHFFSMDLRSCEDGEKTNAYFTWKNPYIDMPQNNGVVVYNCNCTLD